ncbi:hypothetical protein AB0I28_25230 [Phytomonospora sp. NPDC050363]|uniref:hypothetical protein n=1 Tax=Phytomonospora sp. NPDC050363 TaxID=3155642 RepID=UPI0033E3B171
MDPAIVLATALIVVFPVTVGVIAYVVARRKENERVAALAATRPSRARLPPAGSPVSVEALGRHVQTYTTDNNRRAVTAICAFCGGLIVLAFAVPATVLTWDSVTTPGPCGGVLLGGGLGAVAFGLVLGGLSWARRGEVFDVHEGGLAHSYAGATRTFAWDTIADVKPTPGNGGWYHRVTGRDGHCRFLLHGGGTVTVTGFTPGAEYLVQAVERAVFHGETPGARSLPCTICAGTGGYADGSMCDLCGGTGRSGR